MWTIPWWLSLGLLLYGTGLCLIRRMVWRGQDAPLCASCGYDVRADRSGRSGRCPECGAVLSEDNVIPASVRYERHPIRLVPGLLIGLGSFMLGIVALYALAALMRT